MKKETPKEILIRLYGLKESYTLYETQNAMYEYGIQKMNESYDKALDIIHEHFQNIDHEAR